QFNDFLNNKTFYVINSKSERNFPFTLIQQGYEFKKTDNTFKLADYFISQYQLVGKMKEIVYTPLQLNSATGVVLPDSTASFKQVLCSERNNPKAGFLSYGPYINLEKGSYEVIWSLRKDANMEGNLLNLDICFKDGTEIVNFISVMDTSLQENSFTKIALELNVDDPLNKYEFRAYNTGKAPISIESIKIVKKN
ncbi:MAG: hypothetical protein KGP35_09670, partial [Bacteroidetes bacterium]|nr:hypothetical protein [Bacteroidota bacterium]